MLAEQKREREREFPNVTTVINNYFLFMILKAELSVYKWMPLSFSLLYMLI